MQPIRLLLAYAGVEYEDKRYNIGPAPEYDRSEWLADKFNLGLDFPNVIFTANVFSADLVKYNMLYCLVSLPY